MDDLKELIVKQSTEINELKDEINTLNYLLWEYRLAFAKYEPSGLLMDAVGRKLLFELASKEK